MKLGQSRRARSRLLTTVTGLAAAVLALVGAPPGESALASASFAACPDVYPIGDLTPNQPVSVLTVSRGNTPDVFGGEVLGVVKDGIFVGLDMIMVKVDLSGQPDGVSGIWAGMNGSPVYAANGELVGAVAYGLADGPSAVAGVTPAADMKALLGDDAAAAATSKALADAKHVALPRRMQQRLVSEGLATPSAASGGFDQLPLPVAVAGLDSARYNPVQSIFTLDNTQSYGAGAQSADPAPTDLIFPGSNLGAAFFYGDVSFIAMGTTTMVCDGQVVGFGHPFNWDGATSMTMHGADTVNIQDDPTYAGLKVSNVTGPVGEVIGTHLAGISGTLGEFPAITHIESTATRSDGRTQIGNVYAEPQFVGNAAAYAMWFSQDRAFDHVGPGSSRVHYTVEGHTAGGAPFTLERTNRFVDSSDISIESIFDILRTVHNLKRNDFTHVTLDDIHTDTRLSTDQRLFTVGKVERKVGTGYVRLGSDAVIRARAGQTITLRVTLNSRNDQFGKKVVTVKVKAPDARAGSSGALTVGNVPFFSGPASSFAEQLEKLSSARRNDQLRAKIRVSSGQHARHSIGAPTTAHDVVRGSRSFELRITR